jgi:N-acetylglutamate synthase-like GNAT family acetyltransferase
MEDGMQVINLTEEHKDLYFQCLEDWSEDMKDSGDHKACYYEKMKEKGLEVRLAVDDQGKVGGMIEYLPIEYSQAEGEDLYFIHCIWVHGYKKGRGNFQKKGMGKALIRAAEEDAKAKGARGVVAWGLSFPIWMKASWFKKQGYRKVDRQGIQVLLWKPFTADAIPPKWIRPKKKPQIVDGQVTVTAFLNGWCPAQNINFERAKRAASGFGDEVQFKAVNTLERDVMLEWGISDAIFIDNKEISKGPPLKYGKIRKKIEKKIKKIG